MEMDNAQGIISTREGGKVGIQKYPQENTQINFKSTEPVLRQISDPDRFSPLFTLKRALEQFSVYYYFDTSIHSSIRQPSSYGTETKLLPDGQNFMTILNNIKNNHSLNYEKIEEAINKINPYFKDINFALLGSKLYLVLREKYLSRSVSIEHIEEFGKTEGLIRKKDNEDMNNNSLIKDKHPEQLSRIKFFFKKLYPRK